MRDALVAIAAALALLLAAGSDAQSRRGAGPAAKSDITLDFENADITDVIRTISKLTGRNFLYDEGKIRGKITILSPSPVSVEEAYQVFEAILQVSGFATVEGPGGILKIVPSREARQSPIQTFPTEGIVPNRDLFITQLIPLNFTKVGTIQKTLGPLISKDANVIAYEPPS